MDNLKTYLPPLGRFLMSSLFIWDGIRQLRGPSVFAQYFASMHVPLADVAIWISIIVHLLGGMALLVGFKTRWAATLLALLCVGTGFGVHLPIGDQDNMIHFYKNLVMTGGFLYVIAFGACGVSIDGKAGYWIHALCRRVGDGSNSAAKTRSLRAALPTIRPSPLLRRGRYSDGSFVIALIKPCEMSAEKSKTRLGVAIERIRTQQQ